MSTAADGTSDRARGAGSVEAAAHPGTSDGLRRRWTALVADLRLDAAAGPVVDELLAAYGGSGRAYHGLTHLRAVLRLLDELWPHAECPVPAVVRAAAWFHDAVYDPTRADNEERSAAWARRVLTGAGASPVATRTVGRLIEATAAHHLDETLVALPGAACFLDADLAVLGSDPTTYDAYAAAIRSEYHHLDDGTFRLGRARVLAGLATRPHLYLSGAGRVRFEALARANLAREVTALTGR